MKRPLLAGLALALLGLAIPAPATADPTDCDSVPLRYHHRYYSGGETWRVKARLRVYDLCEAGTIRGRVFVGGVGRTRLRSLAPYSPGVAYKRQLDQVFIHRGVGFQSLPRAGGWAPYVVTTDDVQLDDGYFRVIRVRWTVTIHGRTVRRAIICDRVYTTGPNAYDCHV